VSLPTDSIAQVWSSKTSPVRTVGLLTGLMVVGIAVFGAVSFGNNLNLGGSH
jgi:hypothetical protein